MFKKALTSVALAGLVFGHTAAAAAPAERIGAPVSEKENLAGISNVVLILVFAAIAAGIIILIEDSENDVNDLPTSP